MNFKIIIVESPNKAKTLQSYLNNSEYSILSSNGHIYDLTSKNLGFDEKFNPIFELNLSGKRLFKELQKKYKENSNAIICLATDADREGEGIAFHIKEISETIGFKCFERILFKNFTKSNILLSLKEPVSLNYNLALAQQARRLTDRFIGFLLSSQMQKYISKKSGTGRVQAVSLWLLKQQFEKFATFKTQEILELLVDYKNIKHVLDVHDENIKKILLTNNLIYLKEKINFDNEILFENIKQKNELVYGIELVPFKTTTMQKFASRYCNLTPEQTMNAAQHLFEGKDINGVIQGLITYHRTDSNRISDSFLEDIKVFFKKNNIKEDNIDLNNLTTIKDKQLNIQDAHECIRPINLNIIPQDIKDFLTPNEYKLYFLIYFSFLASCLKKPCWNKKTYFFLAKEKLFSFKISSYKLQFKGYNEFQGCDQLFNNNYNYIEDIDSLIQLKLFFHVKKITGPKPLSEINLITKLEENGIGRPSTYSVILPKLLEKQYVYILDKLVHVNKLGVFVANEIINYFPNLIDLNFTKKFEQKLELIVEDPNFYFDIVNEIYQDIMDKIKVYEEYIQNIKTKGFNNSSLCVFCGSVLKILFGKFGLFASCELKKHIYTVNIYDIKENAYIKFQLKEDFIYPAECCKICNKKQIIKLYKNKISLYCLICKKNLEHKINRNTFQELTEQYLNYLICPFIFN